MFNIVLKSWIKGGSHLSTQRSLSHIPIIIIVVTHSRLWASHYCSRHHLISLLSQHCQKENGHVPWWWWFPLVVLNPFTFPVSFTGHTNPYKNLFMPINFSCILWNTSNKYECIRKFDITNQPEWGGWWWGYNTKHINKNAFDSFPSLSPVLLIVHHKQKSRNTWMKVWWWDSRVDIEVNGVNGISSNTFTYVCCVYLEYYHHLPAHLFIFTSHLTHHQSSSKTTSCSLAFCSNSTGWAWSFTKRGNTYIRK